MSSVNTEAAQEASAPARSELWRGVRSGLPVVLAMIPLALALGAQAAQKGLSLLEMGLMASLNFAGGSEFAAVDVWTFPPNALVIAAVTLLVNSRHILMSAALTPCLQHLPRRKALAALFVMCDEAWAMAMADIRQRETTGGSPRFSLQYYMGVGGSLYLIWLVFTLLGASIGPKLGNLETYGFDMVFPAVFLVLLRGLWKGAKAARPWLVSLAAAVITHLAVPGAWYVVAGAAAGLLSACIWAGERAGDD